MGHGRASVRRYYAINHDPISDRIRLTSNQKFDIQDQKAEIPRSEFRRIVRDIFRTQLPGLVHHLWCEKHHKPVLPGPTSGERSDQKRQKRALVPPGEDDWEDSFQSQAVQEYCIKSNNQGACRICLQIYVPNARRPNCETNNLLSAQVNKEELTLQDS